MWNHVGESCVFFTIDFGARWIVQADGADETAKIEVSGAWLLIMKTGAKPGSGATDGGESGLVEGGIRSGICSAPTNR